MLHAENAAVLEHVSLPPWLLINQLDAVLVRLSSRGICSFSWSRNVEQVWGPNYSHDCITLHRFMISLPVIVRAEAHLQPA